MDDKKKELIDSLVELCEKNKIVWINDIVRERIEVDKKGTSAVILDSSKTPLP